MPALTDEDLNLFLSGPGPVSVELTRLEAWHVYRELQTVMRLKYGPTGRNGVGAVAARLQQLIAARDEAPGSVEAVS